MFFYVSLVLVIVAAITLVVGLLSSGLPLVIVSIASSFLAGVFLVLTVLRDRPHPEAPARAAPAPGAAGGAGGGVEEFPIADYDDLKVGEIVPLLSELDDDELEAVREREEAGKGRATILGRVDDLLAEGEPVEGEEEEEEEEREPAAAAGGGGEGVFPIADYDDLKVGEIVPLLPELDDDELEAVYDREEAGKGRAGILDRIDEMLGEELPAPAPAPVKKAPAKRTPAAAAKKAAPKKATASAGKQGFPIAGYDALSAADVAKHLKKLDGDQLKAVRTYEKRKKARKGVLARIDAEMSSR